MRDLPQTPPLVQSPPGIEPLNTDRPGCGQSLYRYKDQSASYIYRNDFFLFRGTVMVKLSQYLIKHDALKMYG